MSTSREEQLDALAVQLREAAYFCTKLEDLEIHCEKVAAELARLAATPKAGVDIRPLDWQETFVDRGDGSKDQSGWEADNGFNGWYSIEMYFGSDSYGWSVQFDTDVIGDFDDPDRAKAAAQKHFEQRISLALPSVLGGVDQPSFADGRQCNEQSGKQLSPAWQPIETAPKDGPFLICGTWLGEPIVRQINGMQLSGKPSTLVSNICPTHWMPLPEPPSSLKLPDYRGGEKIDSTKTAESDHSPSTLNAETEFSDEKKAALKEIDDNLRNAALNAHTIIAGSLTSCRCEHPMIKCDHTGCRCTHCGELRQP